MRDLRVKIRVLQVQYDFPDEEILYLKMKDCDEPLLEEGPEPGSR